MRVEPVGPRLPFGPRHDAVVQFYRDAGKSEQAAEWEAKKEEL